MKKIILFLTLIALGFSAFGQTHEFNDPVYIYGGLQLGWRPFFVDSIYVKGDTLLFYHKDSIFKVPFVPDGAVWGKITGTINDQTDLMNQLNSRALSIHSHIATDITDFQSSVSANGDVVNNTIHRNTTSGNPHSVTASDVGLGNVTNESKSTMFTDPDFTGTRVRLNTDTLATRDYARKEASADSTGFKVDSIIGDGTNAYIFDGGDTLSPYFPTEGTENLGDVAPLWTDTTGNSGGKIATAYYVSTHAAQDTSWEMSFIIGTTVNAPSAGDSILVNSGFDGRRIAAWRDGLRQFYASDEGIEHNDDTLWVHPPFVADERWIVEVTDTNRWDTLALSDTANSLLTGIVAYWMCEESSGNVVDTVGNNDGTVNNGVAYQATGVVDYAWEFNGGTDSVLISNTGDLELQEFSVSLWFQTNYYYPFFTNWDSGNGWYIELNGNTKTRFQIGQSPYPYVESDNDLRSATTWHHCVVTYDGDTLRMYIDGGLQTMKTEFTDVITYTGVKPGFGFKGTSNHLVGKLDEIGVWNRALTQDEIDRLYNSGNANTYPFN